MKEIIHKMACDKFPYISSESFTYQQILDFRHGYSLGISDCTQLLEWTIKRVHGKWFEDVETLLNEYLKECPVKPH